MTIETRRITSADIESYRQCLDEVARERQWLGFLEAPPLAAVVDFVERQIASKVPMFIALDSATVIGWCDLSSRGGHRIDSHAAILGMGLRKSHRGRGVGARLIQATLEAGREAGFERIELRVWANNVRAQRLYRSVGFVEEGRLRADIKVDGRTIDAVVMGLLFAELDGREIATGAQLR
jgi:RimJ/RimL family protein N-acetyltransferase